jgi:CubicO group peptidase (beta-lactamase class C family)
MEIERSVIEFLSSKDRESVLDFKKGILHPDSKMGIEELISIRKDLKSYLASVGIEGTDEGLIFMLSDGDLRKDLEITFREDRIGSIKIKEPEAMFNITMNNIDAVFDSLEREGLSGLISIVKTGDMIIERPFGSANSDLGIPITTETIFGIGSRPIDFTIAALLLLDQEGDLSLDDPINTYINKVPEDKKAMTLRHLMEGKSGLPDFFDTDEDWNPDLAWVNRDEAVARMMQVDLLFEPGTDQRHSHAAFGLLAAIIEKVTGNEYYTFIREQFLDPAKMFRTGEYGETRGLKLEDFAVGNGIEQIGLPNIPPNWGPTSWLVKGSGGMYSTLNDLRSFYEYIYSGKVLDRQHKSYFLGESVSLDGSMRGFELFSIRLPQEKTEAYLFLNDTKDLKKLRRVFQALEQFVITD